MERLTARADDNHAAPVIEFLAALPLFGGILEISNPGKVPRLSSN